MAGASRISAVVIGRNEGERLRRCLMSLRGRVNEIVYVDSGSRDGSVALAREIGATVVELDTGVPFTAARARNAGADAVTGTPEFLQFVDGDCELREGWFEAASGFLDAHPEVAVVCGRRREKFPEASVWNRLTDAEWDTPVGEAKACGGDALMRTAAFRAVGGYDPALIAGEEPELCLRLRAAGWRIHRLGVEMTLHDADMHSWRQYWQRARRAGHTYAEGAAMHGAPPERHNVDRLRRTLAWGLVLPGAAILGTLVTPWSLLLLLAYPLQIARLVARGEDPARAAALTLGKLPEAAGALGYFWRRLTGRTGRIIEYK